MKPEFDPTKDFKEAVSSSHPTKPMSCSVLSFDRLTLIAEPL
jgi:hypothetical protein